jgi:hypothetical protein
VKQILTTFLILAGMPALALAQPPADALSNFLFDYYVNGTTAVSPTGNLGFIQFPNTSTGSKTSITFLVTSSSQTLANYTLTNASVTPGSGFSLLSTQTAVPIGGVGSLQMSFSPTDANPLQTTGAFQFQLVGATGQVFGVYINLYAGVLKPQLILTYVDPVTGNQFPLTPSTLVQFPKISVNSTASSQILVTNTGTGSGKVDSVSVSGAGFTLTNTPLIPATLPAGASFAAGITFSPTAPVEYQGTATISVGGVATTFRLDGQGTSAAIIYNLVSPSGTTVLQPNTTINFPDTPADGVSRNSVTIQIQNTGNQVGSVSNVNSFGSDFQVANLPALPKSLNPGDILLFNVIFQPAKPGSSTGRLQIGNDLFALSGNGIGSALSLAVDVGLGAVAVSSGGVASLPNTTVGSKLAVYFDVTNTGNQPLIVNGISVSGAGFTVPSPPAPVTLNPFQTTQFLLQFAPVSVATFTGTVSVNGATVSLVGVGQAPPPIPAIAIVNVPSVLAPLQQPSAGVQLSGIYPYDLKGTMTLTFLSDSFVDDPSIVFATGGRSINFIIPANTTQAIFTQASGAALGTLALFQTGTVSGTVSLTVSGLTVAQVDVTPATLPSKGYQIPATPPQLRALRVQSFSGSQIVLLISGYSTPRNLSQLSFQFTAASGANLMTTSLNLDVSGEFLTWYDSAASNIFGSQFTTTVTINITGDPKAITGISVTATNSKGTSAPQSVGLN